MCMHELTKKMYANQIGAYTFDETKPSYFHLEFFGTISACCIRTFPFQSYTNNIHHIVYFCSILFYSFFILSHSVILVHVPQTHFPRIILRIATQHTSFAAMQMCHKKHEHNQWELFTKTTFNHRLSCPSEWRGGVDARKIRWRRWSIRIEWNFTEWIKCQFCDECKASKERNTCVAI